MCDGQMSNVCYSLIYPAHVCVSRWTRTRDVTKTQEEADFFQTMANHTYTWGHNITPFNMKVNITCHVIGWLVVLDPA